MLDLEEKLRNYLDINQLYFVSNGTIALQIAIKALGLTGDILTTPFSYVATTSAIAWEGCTPVFVDIDPHSLCIDANLIEKSITSKTIAVLATHVYGNPCDVMKINDIAKRNRLIVIYDAAHAFGVTYFGKSIASFGDIVTFSFHATKLFHTAEGGAIASNNPDFHHKLEYMRRFGHNSPEDFWGIGINGKNSELHAAMGLCMLPKVSEIIKHYERQSKEYIKQLNGTDLNYVKIQEGTSYNYAYFPVIFSNETQLLNARTALNAHEIFPRRYFYPSLNTLNYVKPQSTPVAEDIARRILCLPLYVGLSEREIKTICDIIKKSQGVS